MNYKLKDYVGVFLISGGKNSVLALDMLYLQFISRIGILIEIDNLTMIDNDYIKYLEKKYNMTIIRINSHKSPIENHLLESKDFDFNNKILSNPIYKGLPEIRNFLINMQIDKYKIIFGSNNTKPLDIKENNILLNPLANLSEEEVINECTKRDLKLIDTYEKGFERHDSFPSSSWLNKKNTKKLTYYIELLKKYYPERYNFWVNWEKENNTPFFKSKKSEDIWLHKI